MTSVPRISIEDTYTLIQLMRETALAQGRQMQASKLDPVMEKMQGVVETARSMPAVSTAPAAPNGVMAQTDFKKLLEVSQAKVEVNQTAGSPNNAMERNRLVVAMAGANMPDVDIARQLGMTREEVRLVLNIQNKGRSGVEVFR